MNWDISILRAINVDGSGPFLDAVMPVISDLKWFIPLIVVVVAWMLVKDGRRGRVTVLALILTVAATDQLSSSLLKPLAGRYRPCHPSAAIEGIRVHGHCSSRPTSFPSSHAANTAAVAALLLLRYRRRALVAAVISLLVGYSRVYLGVHYPSDVLGGWVIGAVVGSAIALLAALRERGRSGKGGPPGAEAPAA